MTYASKGDAFEFTFTKQGFESLRTFAADAVAKAPAKKQQATPQRLNLQLVTQAFKQIKKMTRTTKTKKKAPDDEGYVEEFIREFETVEALETECVRVCKIVSDETEEYIRRGRQNFSTRASAALSTTAGAQNAGASRKKRSPKQRHSSTAPSLSSKRVARSARRRVEICGTTTSRCARTPASAPTQRSGRTTTTAARPR